MVYLVVVLRRINKGLAFLKASMGNVLFKEGHMNVVKAIKGPHRELKPILNSLKIKVFRKCSLKKSGKHFKAFLPFSV